MALNAAIVWEVRFGGSDTNGGGFKTGATGTDWTLQDSAQYSVTDGVTAGTTTITSATANFGTDVVGNVMYVQGGTGSVVAGWYEITARGSSTSITVDRSTGLTAGTGVTLKIGGALATPGMAVSLATVNGHKVYWKYNASDYTITTATPGSGGPVLFASAIIATLIGYDVTRNDDTGNRPCINWGAVSAPGALTYLIACLGAAAQSIINCKVNCNSVDNVGGINSGANARNMAYNCHAVNANGSAGVGINGHAIKSFVHTAVNGMQGGNFYGCTVTACSTAGFLLSTNNATVDSCIAYNCTGDGFVANTFAIFFRNCTSDGNTLDGYDMVSSACFYFNCIASYNYGYGFNASVANVVRLQNCADIGNSLGRLTSAAIFDFNSYTPTGDPYIDRAGADFRLDNTTNEGASLRGVTGVYGQTNNRDIGAVQHSDPSTTGSGYSKGRVVNR